MGDYVLVSARPLTHMKRKGFLGEFPGNQATNLEDGTRCFVTRLSPAALDGSLEVRWSTASGDLREHVVTFRTRLSTRTRTITVNGVERAMGDSLPALVLPPPRTVSSDRLRLAAIDGADEDGQPRVG